VKVDAARRARNAPLLATVLAAGAMRALYWRALEGHRELLVPVLDGAANLEWARGLLAGRWPGGEPFFRAPGYIVALAGLLGASGGDPARVAALQLALGVVTPALAALLGLRLFGTRGAWIAGLGAALYPTLFFFDAQLLAPVLAVPAFAAAVLVALAALEHGGLPRSIGAGALFGVATVAYPPLLLGGVGAAALLARRRLRDGAALAAALLAAPLLATAHNAACGDPSFVATQGGLNLYLGNARTADGVAATFAEAPTALGYRMVDAAARIAERAEGRALEPSEVSGYWTRRALGEIAADPARWLGLVVKKTFLAFSAREIPNNQDIALVAQEIPLLGLPGWGVWAPLAVVGLLAHGRRRGAGFLAYAAGAVLSGCVVFFVNDRFRVPAAPLVVALGAGGALAIVDAARERSRGRAAALALVALGAAVVARLNPYGIPERPWVMSYVLVAEAERDRGEPVRALRWIERALAEEPGLYPARLAQVEMLRRVGRLAEARAAADRALADLPDDPALLHERAILRDLAGDPAGGLADVERALARDPTLESARVSRAVLLARLGRAEEATRALRELLAGHPSGAEAARAQAVLEEIERGALGPKSPGAGDSGSAAN
jgi:tetratricopeptide (TPR) repeat protein